MNTFTHKLTATLLVSFYSLVGFSSSAYASGNEEVANNLSANATGSESSVVFGKFRLMKNGEEIELGDGLFGNSAVLRLYRATDQEELTGRVGKDGEFSMELAPGDYYLMSIAFKHRGETIEPETNFMFNVSSDFSANYVGTITLETSFGSGYNGMKGSIDRIMIGNDCATDCDRRMEQLGLANNALATSLPHWETQVAWGK